MARQARAEATRSAIIRAAAEMFDRYGYGSTRLSDILTHARVTKGALYFHFSSKEELAFAVLQEQHSIFVGHATFYADLEAPALESLIRLSYRLGQELQVQPVVRGGIRLTLERWTFQRPLPDPYQDWITISTEMFKRAVAELDIRTDVPLGDVARFMVSAFTGVQLVAQVLGERRELGERIAGMWYVILPGLVLPRKQIYYLRFVRTAQKEVLDHCG